MAETSPITITRRGGSIEEEDLPPSFLFGSYVASPPTSQPASRRNSGARPEGEDDDDGPAVTVPDDDDDDDGDVGNLGVGTHLAPEQLVEITRRVIGDDTESDLRSALATAVPVTTGEPAVQSPAAQAHALSALKAAHRDSSGSSGGRRSSSREATPKNSYMGSYGSGFAAPQMARSTFQASFLTEYGSRTDIGGRGDNQDDHCALLKFGGNPKQALFGVFDGHGKGGKEAAAYIRKRLPYNLEQDNSLDIDPKAALERAFITTHANIQADIPAVCRLSGATATAVLIRGLKLYIAHVGDTRAILVRQAGSKQKMEIEQLTRDHRVEDEQERLRIEAAGGCVLRRPDWGHLRVYPSPEPGQPGINLARTLGDTVFHNAGLSCIPDVSVRKLSEQDKCIVVASDGLWDVMSSEKAAQIALKHFGNPEKASKKLVDSGLARWTAKFGAKGDNITAVVIFLHPLAADSTPDAGRRDTADSSSQPATPVSGSIRKKCAQQ